MTDPITDIMIDRMFSNTTDPMVICITNPITVLMTKFEMPGQVRALVMFYLLAPR